VSYTLKYKDDEGDLVTIASDSELKEALRLAEPGKCPRLYVVPVSPKKDKIEEIEEPQVSLENKDTLSVEIQFQDKSEAITIPKVGASLPYLKEKVASLFSSLPKDFILKYLDDEGDAVTMTEQEELNDALQLAQDGQVLVITAIATSSNNPERTESAVQEEEEKGKKKKQWEDITWDDLNETLEKLQKLGFTDTALCTRLLEKCNYDFDAVLLELKQRSDKQAEMEEEE